MHQGTDGGRKHRPAVDGRSERRQVAVRRAVDVGVDERPGGQFLEAVDQVGGLVSRAVDRLGEASSVAQWAGRDAPATERRPTLNDRTMK